MSAAACAGCAKPFRLESGVVTWPHDQGSDDRARTFRTLALRQLNPLASRLSPLRHFSDWRLEGYYRRTLNDAAFAREWGAHYLAGLSLPPGSAVLDYGCGRGRHVGLLTQLGFRVGAQDIHPHAWWRLFRDCGFQTVPPSVPRLPWAERSFNAVLDVTVIHHLDTAQLATLAAEVFRVLAPGGYWILVEANAGSYGAAAPRKYYGRLHELPQVQDLATAVGFREIDHGYEGFYAPVFPNLVNFLRKQIWPAPFTVDDFDSSLAARIAPGRRALWKLRVQKPAVHG